MKKVRDFYQVSLKIFLKNQKGEVLALKADDKGSYAGYYDFPGGRIDVDEFKVPFTEIIDREIKEEIGKIEYKLNSKPMAVGRHLIPAHLTSAKKEIRVLYLFFEAEYIAGDIKISPEHQGFVWLDLSRVRGIEVEKYFKSGNLEGVKMYLNQ